MSNQTNSRNLIFNKFQSDFYTDINAFNKYTHHEIKQNSFLLLNNLIKGYPNLANEILNIYSPDVKALESPEIIFALQRKFINGFSRARIPQFIYYKSEKSTSKVIKDKKLDKNLIQFEPDIVSELQTILMMDSKTFQYLQYTEKVQTLGKSLLENKYKVESDYVNKLFQKME